MPKHSTHATAAIADQGWYWAMGQVANTSARREIERRVAELQARAEKAEREADRYRQAAQAVFNPTDYDDDEY